MKDITCIRLFVDQVVREVSDAANEMAARIRDLETENAELKTRIKDLESRLSNLKAIANLTQEKGWTKC